MLWVGGNIMRVALEELGWKWPYAQVQHLEVAAHDATGGAGAVVGWLANTLASAVVGVVVGAVAVTVLHLLPLHRGVDKAGRAAGH